MIMKKFNKVIVAMIVMTLTTTVSATAGNKKYGHNDKHATVVVVNNKKSSHYEVLDTRSDRVVAHKKFVYRPTVKTCTFRVSRHAAPHHAVAKVERIHGVINAYWNPRTREMTVSYDARKTTARHIMHSMA